MLNPVASIDDMQRHLRGEPEMFGCLAGWKSFYLEWHLHSGVVTTGTGSSATSETLTELSALRDGSTARMIDC